MDAIRKQEFDFTDDSNQEMLKDWCEGFRDIPFPEKDLFVNGLHLDEEDLAEIAMTATHQFIDVNPDTWFWISAILLRDGTARLEFECAYSVSDEARLLPIVNRAMKRMGFGELESLDFPTRPLATWQQAYDFFCDLARSRKTAAIVVQSHD